MCIRDSLGSTAAILSRGFCDANIVKDPMEIEAIFVKGVRNIRSVSYTHLDVYKRQVQRHIQSKPAFRKAFHGLVLCRG